MGCVINNYSSAGVIDSVLGCFKDEEMPITNNNTNNNTNNLNTIYTEKSPINKVKASETVSTFQITSSVINDTEKHICTTLTNDVEVIIIDYIIGKSY